MTLIYSRFGSAPSASQRREVLSDELQLRILGWLVADDCPSSFGTQYAAKEAIIGKGGLIEFPARYEFDNLMPIAVAWYSRSCMAKPLPSQNRFDLCVLCKLVQKKCEHEVGP